MLLCGPADPHEAGHVPCVGDGRHDDRGSRTDVGVADQLVQIARFPVVVAWLVGGEGGLVEEGGEVAGDGVEGVGALVGGGQEDGASGEAVFVEEEGEVFGGDGVVAGVGLAVAGVELDGGVAGGCGGCGGGGCAGGCGDADAGGVAVGVGEGLGEGAQGG